MHIIFFSFPAVMDNQNIDICQPIDFWTTMAGDFYAVCWEFNEEMPVLFTENLEWLFSFPKVKHKDNYLLSLHMLCYLTSKWEEPANFIIERKSCFLFIFYGKNSLCVSQTHILDTFKKIKLLAILGMIFVT